MANDDAVRPYPPINFIDSDNWQSYTKPIPANEDHERVCRRTAERDKGYEQAHRRGIAITTPTCWWA